MSASDSERVTTDQPTKDELLASDARRFDTDRLQFDGLRGDSRLHLDRDQLEAAISSLPPAPAEEGVVDLLVARGPNGERVLPSTALLTVDGGMPGDRWVDDDRYGPDYQLATTRTDFARAIGNGQELSLHGDNLFLTLDVSDANLPVGSVLQLGGARVCVTPIAHNGCKKWAQRFGLAAMQLNIAWTKRGERVRGIYLRVIEDGLVRVGDPVRVLSRGVV